VTGTPLPMVPLLALFAGIVGTYLVGRIAHERATEATGVVAVASLLAALGSRHLSSAHADLGR